VMSWSEVFIALLISHVVGDVLLQTDWQALNKSSGLGHSLGRRALVLHVSTYVVAFIPPLVWIGGRTSPLRAIGVGALVGISHLLIDDGRLVRVWLRDVKRTAAPTLGLLIATDQSFHLLCLFAASLVAAA
jgi:Protein of unknown function (DUF3307)